MITPETSAEAIISTMNDGLVLLDDENRIVETNAALVSMLGRGHGELLGAPAETLFAGSDGGDGVLSAVRSGEQVSDREIVLENHDGRSLFASLSRPGRCRGWCSSSGTYRRERCRKTP